MSDPLDRLPPAPKQLHYTYRARLKRNPSKACCKCFSIFPNTEAYFATGHRDRVTNTCITCFQRQPKKKDPSTPQVVEECPLCRELRPLVLDKKAPVIPDHAPMLVCRRCIMVLNMIESMARPAHALSRLAQYMNWRGRK